MRFQEYLILSSAAVVAFDVIASVASVALQFPYQYAAWGSAILYIFFASFAALKFSFWRGVLVGAVLGIVDSTIGWAASWIIGPSRVPLEQFGFGVWVVTLLFVLGLGVIYGFIGACIGFLVRKVRAA